MDWKNRRTWRKVFWRSREGGGGGGGGGGRIVIQDMLSKGSGEHVLWSPDGGGDAHWGGGGDAPRPVVYILVSWHWRSLVPAGFSPHLAPCDTDGPAGSARWPFSRLGFRGVRGWRTAREQGTARG